MGKRLDEAEQTRWMGLGNTLSHEKKMEAIVKGTCISVEVLTHPVANLPRRQRSYFRDKCKLTLVAFPELETKI